MQNMKRCFAVAAAVCGLAFAGCGAKQTDESTTKAQASPEAMAQQAAARNQAAAQQYASQQAAGQAAQQAAAQGQK